MQIKMDDAANLRLFLFYWQPGTLVPHKLETMTHEEFIQAAGDLVLAGSAAMDKSRDQDQGKGAVEQDQNKQGGNTSMSGQLGHRDEDVELKGADSGFSG